MNEQKWSRLLKIFSLLIPTSYAFFVSIDNAIFAWNDNYQFVKHVMSMDTVKTSVNWRSINTPILWEISYNLLIIFEIATFLTGVIGLIQLIKNFNKEKKIFEKSKFFGYITFFLSILVWFFGFIDIGGEWFKMFLSPSWNGQPIAMWLSILFCVLLSLFNQAEH